MINQFARTEQLLGPEAMAKIAKAKVAVFGLGAVGSFAVEALARTGVGNLHLVDFDRVDASNINRQLYALHSTIGKEKTVIARSRIQDINPGCHVTVQESFINADSLSALLSKDIDIVVDAIDGLNSKVNLIIEARKRHLTVISSMGAGGRTDISMIKTADISQTSVCPLARVVRQRLHRRGLYEGVSCIYSVEKPLNKQPYHKSDVTDALSDHGRSRPPIGTVPYVTGAFGLFVAMEVVRRLTLS